MQDTEKPDAGIFDSSKWFTAKEEDLEQFRTLYAFSDIIVSFNHYWIDEHTPIESLDSATGRVTMAYHSRFHICPGQEYILENVAEQFHGKNEWYLDRANGMLYYIPRNDAQTPENVEVWAPVTDRLITISGRETEDGFVSGVRFRDITFSCTITHIGRRYYSACGILIMHASDIDILHNEISDLYYTGVSVGRTWGYARTVCRDNRIIGNHIYDLGKGFLSDMGGVYLLGSQPGTIVANNRIHNIKCKEYGGWALYTDEGSAGITLENNLCYRTSSNSYHQHYGSLNVVRNNIFADAGEPMLRCSRPEAHLSILFYNNIVYSSGTTILADYAQDAPGNFGVEDGAIVSMRNLLWCRDSELVYCSKENLRTLADAQKAGLEQESIVADPLFVDPDHDDYTLEKDSPAFALGFREFDWKSCGVRK